MFSNFISQILLSTYTPFPTTFMVTLQVLNQAFRSNPCGLRDYLIRDKSKYLRTRFENVNGSTFRSQFISIVKKSSNLLCNIFKYLLFQVFSCVSSLISLNFATKVGSLIRKDGKLSQQWNLFSVVYQAEHKDPYPILDTVRLA